jgi:hypothetical protein
MSLDDDYRPYIVNLKGLGRTQSWPLPRIYPILEYIGMPEKIRKIEVLRADIHPNSSRRTYVVAAPTRSFFR